MRGRASRLRPSAEPTRDRTWRTGHRSFTIGLLKSEEKGLGLRSLQTVARILSQYGTSAHDPGVLAVMMPETLESKHRYARN